MPIFEEAGVDQRLSNHTYSSDARTSTVLALLALSTVAACGPAASKVEVPPTLRAVPQVATAPLSDSFASVVSGGRFLLFRDGVVVDLKSRRIAHRFPGTRLLRRSQQPHRITIAQYRAGGGIVDLASGHYLCRAPLGSQLEDAVIDRSDRTCLLLTRERKQLELREPAFTATVVELESGATVGSSVVTGPPGLRGFELRNEGEVDEGRAWSIHARSGFSKPTEPYRYRVYVPMTRHEIRLSTTDGRPLSDWREIEPDYGFSRFDNGWPWNHGFHERDAVTPEHTPDSDTLSAVEVIPGVRVAWATGDLRVLVTRGEGFAKWSVEKATREATTEIPVRFLSGTPSTLLDEHKIVLSMATTPAQIAGRDRRLRQPMIWDTQEGSWAERSMDSALKEDFFLSPQEFPATPCGLTFFARDGVVELILTDREAPQIGRPRERSIARFIEFGNGEWIVLGEDGIYNGSAGATKHVAWFRQNGSLASTEDVAAMRQPEELRRRIRAALDCEGNSD